MARRGWCAAAVLLLVVLLAALTVGGALAAEPGKGQGQGQGKGARHRVKVAHVTGTVQGAPSATSVTVVPQARGKSGQGTAPVTLPGAGGAMVGRMETQGANAGQPVARDRGPGRGGRRRGWPAVTLRHDIGDAGVQSAWQENTALAEQKMACKRQNRSSHLPRFRPFQVHAGVTDVVAKRGEDGVGQLEQRVGAPPQAVGESGAEVLEDGDGGSRCTYAGKCATRHARLATAPQGYRSTA
jgi:hypothetical protein